MRNVRVRVWGFPTSGGGVNYYLCWNEAREWITEFGEDDMGNSLNNTMEVEEFLASVQEQHDYAQIKKCVQDKVDNTL